MGLVRLRTVVAQGLAVCGTTRHSALQRFFRPDNRKALAT